MPPRTVTVTFDDGAQHVYQNVPETITPDAIESRAASEAGKRVTAIDGGRFEQTPGGAATGNPNAVRAARAPSATEKVGEIVGATGLGAAAGAFAPEILTGLGAAAAAFPVTAPAAPFLFGAGQATRGARLLSAGAGAISGGAAEIAGQGAESAGAGPVASEGVRMAAGGITPEFKNLAMMGLRKAAGGLGLSGGLDAVRTWIANQNGKQALSEAQEQYLKELVTTLRGGAKTDAPMHAVYGGLQQGALNTKALSYDEAQKVLNTAQLQAEQTMQDANGGVAKLRSAKDRLTEIGQTATQAAQANRLHMAPERDLSDIGGDLRTMIVSKNDAALKQRAADYGKLEESRDAIVQGKENAGQFVEQLPEYKNLVKELEGRLLKTREARMGANTLPVGDQGTERSLQSILDAINSRRVMISEFEAQAATEKGYKVIKGTNPQTGEPAVYREFPTSFQALDDVRRRLGEVYRGNPAEGYDAIGANNAKRYYSMISDIQKKFAGEPQEKLLSQYSGASEGLQKFDSKAGQRATATDRYDDTRFATDASILPKQFFKTKQGVQDLLDLTGDKSAISQAAHQYAVNQLAGKNEQQVRSWMVSNRDWLSAMPDVYMSVSKYASALNRGERIASSVERGIGIVSQKEALKVKDASAFADELRTAAERQAAGITKAGDQTANTLLGDKFPVERVRNLIESGSVEQWQAAGPVLRSNTQAKQAVFDAVKQVIADRADRSTKGIGDFFERNVRPAVEGAGLVTPAQSQSIRAQLVQIENMKVPEAQKLGFAKRLLLQTVSGYAASAGARGIAAAIPD